MCYFMMFLQIQVVNYVRMYMVSKGSNGDESIVDNNIKLHLYNHTYVRMYSIYTMHVIVNMQYDINVIKKK